MKALCKDGVEIAFDGELGCDASATSLVRALLTRVVI